ncbi:hypothetical protein QJQ45_023532 [Haematococcus lacustris]|nr:hypothetical protein QJQ45_023532 [Haematococcus lacustris]
MAAAPHHICARAAKARQASASTSLEATLLHITVTLATWDVVWEVHLDPEWTRQRLRLYGAQDRALEQFFKLEEENANLSMKRHGRAKQLVVFFGAATIGTRGGWGADAVLRACCKVVSWPRGIDQRRGRVVLVDEHRTSRVSSAVNGQQPCEGQLDRRKDTRPAVWKPPAGQVDHRLLRPALGPSTPPPAKRSKRTKAEQAAEPTQPTKGKGKAQGKAAKAKPAPQPGRWLDRDCNAALNMQRIWESRWRPLELCYWPDQGALQAKGKENPSLGYKRLRDKPPKAQQQQQQQQQQQEPNEAQHSASTSLEANLLHITVTLATWDVVWEVHLDPEWDRQRLRLYGAQNRALEQFFKPLEVGPSTPPPAKRSKHTKAEQAAEPTQPTKGKGKAHGRRNGLNQFNCCAATLHWQNVADTAPVMHSQLMSLDQSRLFWATVGAVTGTVVATAVYYASKNTYEQYIPLQVCQISSLLPRWVALTMCILFARSINIDRAQSAAGWHGCWPSTLLDGEVSVMTALLCSKQVYLKVHMGLLRADQRPVRVYLDGCFDMMHYGHANALRQAKTAGDQLVVGLIPDSEILRCKGPPVQTEDERLVLVDAVKWVDEVITGVPYDLSPEFLHELFTKHRIDYIVHGDDPCLLPDGTDAYAHAKALGRFRMIKRTEGVSTTDIVGRMLTCTRVNPTMLHPDQPHPLARDFSMGRESGEPSSSSGGNGPTTSSSSTAAGGDTSRRDDARTTLSKFLPTSRRLVQFSNGRIAPEGARIVYIDGAFDVFHPGHVKILKAAKAQGEFLLVGLHTDEDVQERRGPHLPIMNLHERSLSVLACKFVDEVIMGSPTVITDDLIKTFNIHLVVRGTVSETGHHEGLATEPCSSGTTSPTQGQPSGGLASEHATAALAACCNSTTVHLLLLMLLSLSLTLLLLTAAVTAGMDAGSLRSGPELRHLQAAGVSRPTHSQGHHSAHRGQAPTVRGSKCKKGKEFAPACPSLFLCAGPVVVPSGAAQPSTPCPSPGPTSPCPCPGPPPTPCPGPPPHPLPRTPPPPPAQDPFPPPAQAPPPPPPAQAQPLPAAPGPAPPPQAPPGGRWLDRDTNGCLNLQRIGESRQRPIELCRWDDLEALPPIGEEYQQGYKRVNDRLPKGRQWLHRAAEYRRGIDGRPATMHKALVVSHRLSAFTKHNAVSFEEEPSGLSRESATRVGFAVIKGATEDATTCL